jgi:hypothetical protein
MSAYNTLGKLIIDNLTQGLEQVSPVMYDEHLLDKKVSVLFVQKNGNRHIILKMKIIVEEIDGRPEVFYEEIPINQKYSS